MRLMALDRFGPRGHEFRGDLESATERLPYLADLGVNCVEATLTWSGETIGFLGVAERFVDAAH